MQPHIFVAGGANIDILGRAAAPLIPRDSNPGVIGLSCGGVGRNIAENLTRLGAQVSFLFAAGDDSFSRMLVHSCRQLGMDTSHSYIRPGGRPCMYLAIMGQDGDMALALSDMECVENIPLSHLKAAAGEISQCDVLVLDCNLSRSALELLISAHQDRPIIVDAVSGAKVVRLKGLLKGVHSLKVNRLEAQMLCGVEYSGPEDLHRIRDRLLAAGLKNLYVSMGAEGVYYADEHGWGQFPAARCEVVDATGAGDAFSAGIAFCAAHGLSPEKTAPFASAMSALTLGWNEAVSPQLTLEEVITKIGGNHHEFF